MFHVEPVCMFLFRAKHGLLSWFGWIRFRLFRGLGVSLTGVQSLNHKEGAVINEYGNQTSDQGTEGPDEKLRRAAADFTRSVQEAATRLTTAVESLSSQFGDALRIFSEEQHAASRRQEEFRDESQRAMELAQSHAERASNAATETLAGQQRSTDLIERLEREREGLALLVEDLRGRITAVAVLAAPLPSVGGEHSSGSPEPASEPTGWEGQPRPGEMPE